MSSFKKKGATRKPKDILATEVIFINTVIFFSPTIALELYLFYLINIKA